MRIQHIIRLLNSLEKVLLAGYDTADDVADSYVYDHCGLKFHGRDEKRHCVHYEKTALAYESRRSLCLALYSVNKSECTGG